MTRVRIPPVLRTHVGGEKEVDARGATIGDLLRDLAAGNDGLAEQLFAPDGGLHRFVNVYVNGQDVRYLQVLDTPVTERDAVIILPAMAGGSAAGGS
jgi:molybdopterin converting factor small subunit